MIKVLVVDDSALVRKLFGAVLGNEPDLEVTFARSGVEALEQLHTLKPDVITLDVQMPGMNGLECLDRIMLEGPRPVVMVSSLTEANADETLQALRLGAVDFIAKPGGAVSLRIQEFAPRLLEKVRAAAAAKVRTSLRLKERVQHRTAAVASLRIAPRATARPAPESPAMGAGLVVVGTSTGGPPALEALLVPLPASFPWPIVIAQHMPASFTGPLARRLDSISAIRVLEVSRPVMLEAGCAYLARGEGDVIIARRGGALYAMAASPEAGYPWHPSTDRLVRTAMDHVPPGQLVGVLMTGMGNDGAAAMARLHAEGGRTIAESEETAVIWGMPGELAKAGGADWVLPLPQIADRLQQTIARHAAHS
ncbi:MAG TPA: chemotaxis-specific protein-glutamate methyltransferase CheB [Usitatibacter sp.]|nr:chemotaxis-specific protein-glutamate methyltransferase CheB [Usitatibacter sp.]